MAQPRRDNRPREAEVEELLDQLEELEGIVDEPEELEQVRETMSVARRIPGSSLFSERIQRYTTHDIAEAFVGGVILSLPLLVEDGVFDIARWFLRHTVLGLPVLLLGNVLFILGLTIGLIYWSDFRQVEVTEPVLGLIPRRLVGVLSISLLTATGLFVLWGRHVAGNPNGMTEILARLSVVWAAAAFGGALGDILPGEGSGTNVTIEDLTESLVRASDRR